MLFLVDCGSHSLFTERNVGEKNTEQFLLSSEDGRLDGVRVTMSHTICWHLSLFCHKDKLHRPLALSADGSGGVV